MLHCDDVVIYSDVVTSSWSLVTADQDFYHNTLKLCADLIKRQQYYHTPKKYHEHINLISDFAQGPEIL